MGMESNVGAVLGPFSIRHLRTSMADGVISFLYSRICVMSLLLLYTKREERRARSMRERSDNSIFFAI